MVEFDNLPKYRKGEGVEAIPGRELVVERIGNVEFRSNSVNLMLLIGEVLAAGEGSSVQPGDVVLYAQSLLPLSPDFRYETLFEFQLWGKITGYKTYETKEGTMVVGYAVKPLNGYAVIVPLEEPDLKIGGLYVPSVAQDILVPCVLVDVYDPDLAEAQTNLAVKKLHEVIGKIVLVNIQAARRIMGHLNILLAPYNSIIGIVTDVEGTVFQIGKDELKYIQEFYPDLYNDSIFSLMGVVLETKSSNEGTEEE